MSSEQRRLAAIVSADVVGYSRLMGRDEWAWRSIPSKWHARRITMRPCVGMVLVLSGPTAFANRSTIVAAAARHKVPAIFYDADYVASGSLVSYEPSLTALHGEYSSRPATC
jgi:hypothetical protein